MYKWNDYGLKITVKIEVPKEVNNLTRWNCSLKYDEIKENYTQTFDYLGDWDGLYTDDKRFVYSSLIYYIFGDVLDIFWRYNEIQNRKRLNYGRNIQSFN